MTARKYPPICSFPECGRAHNSRGLCGPHGAMQIRGEDLRPLQNRTGPPARPSIDRFMSKIEAQADGCILWTGGKTLGGYGMFAPGVAGGPARVMAHRWYYEQLVGPIPTGYDIDHLCRVRACVNPAHLEPVTRQENIRRAAAVKTQCPQGHEYNEANTYIRPGTVHRSCRACSHARSLAIAPKKNAKRRAERVSKPRAVQTHCHRGHRLSGENLYTAPGSATRHCRECRRQNASKARGGVTYGHLEDC